MKDAAKEREVKVKDSLVVCFIIYLFTLILVFNLNKAYLQADDKTITNIFKLMEVNMSQPIFMPTIEYRKLFLLTTMAFIIWALLIITDNKKYMLGVEHGSARWATKKEKIKFQDKDDKNNIILSDEIKMSLNAQEIRKNLNVLILGGSGTGKTRYYVKPNLMQMNTSYIITDPKGELFIETANMFKNNGYKIRIFNIKNMLETMHYNPFKYIRKEQDVFKLIKTLIKNTDDGAKGNDPFWEKAETALLGAIMFYLYQEIREEDQTLPNVMKLLRCAKVSEDDEESKSPLDIIFDNLEKEKGETIAVKQYKVFKAGAGKTAKSILITAMSRLAFLDIEEIQEMFSYDEMNLESIGEEKTAFYVIMPDTDSSFNFIIAMLYTQMLDILCQKADSDGTKIPIRFILDEFANIGKIPDFEKVLSTIRSRNISANIILQSIAQIEGGQYKDVWKAIVDNCDSILFLGGKETTEYISKKLGKTTINNKNNSYSKGRNNSTSINEGILARELLTADEIQKMPDDESIVLIRSCNPMYTKKYRIEKHPKYKELGDVKDFENKNNANIREFLNNSSIKFNSKPSLNEILSRDIYDSKDIEESNTNIMNSNNVTETLENDLKSLEESFANGEIRLSGEDLE